jgi:hypothetical protein
MVAYACNPALGRLRQEDIELQANLGYSARLGPAELCNETLFRKAKQKGIDFPLSMEFQHILITTTH